MSELALGQCSDRIKVKLLAKCYLLALERPTPLFATASFRADLKGEESPTNCLGVSSWVAQAIIL